MPEFVIEKRNIPVLTIASNDGPSGGSTGENSLGFRITGGADFEMPITVFQVRRWRDHEKRRASSRKHLFSVVVVAVDPGFNPRGIEEWLKIERRRHRCV